MSLTGYLAALRRLQQAGIRTIDDEQAGAETYATLRSRWDGYIRTISPAMAYTAEEIDPAGSRPESADEREEFRSL